jgi:hypothetical protein
MRENGNVLDAIFYERRIHWLPRLYVSPHCCTGTAEDCEVRTSGIQADENDAARALHGGRMRISFLSKTFWRSLPAAQSF